MPKTYRKRKIAIGVVLLLIVALIVLRLYLPTLVLNFINSELSDIGEYRGEAQAIDINLYRGAYAIKDLEIKKIDAGMPVPFAKAETIDFSVDWRALFQGKIVSKAHIDQAVLNFAVNPQGTQIQNGTDVDWTDTVKKIMPIDINKVIVTHSKVTYRNFSTSPKINLDIHGINGEIRNLRNVVEKDQPMPSQFHFTAESIGKGKVQLDGRTNILTRTPEVELALKLEKVDLPALNNYFRAFTYVDVEKGNFDLYSELAVHKGKVEGYVKPIASHISFINLQKDTNPIKLIWESFVSVVVTIFTNHSQDQFATKIPISGSLDNINTNSWAAIGGIVKNAFIKALTKGSDKELKFFGPVLHKP